MGPGRRAAQPIGVVAGGDQQGGGGVDSDSVQFEQSGGDFLDQVAEQPVQRPLLGVEGQDPSAQAAQRRLGGEDRRVAVGGGPHGGGLLGDDLAGQALQGSADLLRGGEP